MKELIRDYKSLELEKILLMLAENTSCDESRNKVLSILPSSNLDTVNRLLKETYDAHMIIAKFKSPSFNGLLNIKESLKKARTGYNIGNVELLRVSQVLHVFNSLYKFREQFSNLRTTLDVYFDSIISNNYLENKIKSIVISEDEISDNASDNLFEIRQKIRKTSDKTREHLDKMLHSRNIQKYLQENIVTIRESRFVLPVKSEFRKNIPGLVHDTSSSGSTLFIEPISVVEANNEIRLLKLKEKREIEKILHSLSVEVGKFSESIITSYEVALDLDIIFAKADLAHKMKANMPKVNNEGKIKLIKARHPLIEREKVVPVDIELGCNFDSLIITGPNTGGKTVTLKTVGLFTLMTMCGLMIPVSEYSTISVFENVLADIGDEQSIEQSLSTFSSHVKNIIRILSIANDRSLVLLDELGAGTDPIEGAALAMAIIENLKEKNVKLIATTHYAELKAYAISNNKIENGCCEFDVSTLKPTYKLLIGVPGRSNAFAISEKLGIGHSIIEKAKDFISKNDTIFEDVVKRLEDSRNNLEKERAKVAKMIKEIEREREKINLERKDLNFKCEKEIERAKQNAVNIVNTTRYIADGIISELENLKKRKNLSDSQIRTLKSKLNKLEDNADPIQSKDNEDYVLPRKLKKGDIVLIFDIDKKGTVVDINEAANEIIVQAGIIKTRVSAENLRLLNEESEKPILTNGRIKAPSRVDAPIKRKIDLRGQTALEAIIELDKFIDDAVLLGINQISVIHGKGTGVLRREISKHLKVHPSVKSYRLGTFGEGESGVTIVELK